MIMRVIIQLFCLLLSFVAFGHSLSKNMDNNGKAMYLIFSLVAMCFSLWIGGLQ